MSKMLDTIFQKKPEQYGLRGDPMLWLALQTYFANTPCPPNIEEFSLAFHRAFQELVGNDIHDQIESVYVEAFDCGGMSRGHVYLPFWRNKALPMLIKRLQELINNNKNT